MGRGVGISPSVGISGVSWEKDGLCGGSVGVWEGVWVCVGRGVGVCGGSVVCGKGCGYVWEGVWGCVWGECSVCLKGCGCVWEGV